MPNRSFTGVALALRNALATIEVGLRELHRIQYSAPWKSTRRGAR